MKTATKELLIKIAIGVVIAIMIVAMPYLMNHRWNDGYCVECGHKYTTTSTIVKGTERTYFHCDACGYDGGFIEDYLK